MTTKKRITVTVDPELLKAGNRAVKAGRFESISAWVNEALADKNAHEERLAAGRAAVADYEAEFGKITDDERAEQRRLDRENAVRTDPKNFRRRRSA